MSDPCNPCPDAETRDVFGCPRLSLRPCETVEGCEYQPLCMGGALCSMIFPHGLDLDAGQARELAEYMAARRPA
jgi:hypothetical protein